MCTEPVSSEDQGDSQLSDCESGTSLGDATPQFSFAGFVKLHRGELMYRLMEQKLGSDAEIEGAYRNTFSTVMGDARQKSFRVYSAATEAKLGGGGGSEVCAWYGASMAEIRGVIEDGFGFSSQNGVYGRGIYLSPDDRPLNSLLSATPAADGRRCVLLCRVILGRPEVIFPGSVQYKPSGGDFDSGVDSLSSPTTYVIWNSRANTHILPETVVIFNTSGGGRKKAPSSEFVPFSAMTRALSRVLPGDAMDLITKVHAEYRKEKMSRMEMVERVRNIAGDRLLLGIIRSYGGRRGQHF